MDHSKTSPFSRQAILISGASTGIGQCCALQLAQRGFQLFAGFRKREDAEVLQTLHPNIIPMALDITDENSIRQVVIDLQKQLQGHSLHGLINNAGLVISGPVEFTPLDLWRQQLEVNLIGHIGLTQACLPLLRQNQGRIVNMGSVAGICALPFLAPYSVSKFALRAFSDALRVEVQPWGVKVALIEPGSIATPLWAKSRQKAQAIQQAMPDAAQSLYGTALRQIEAASIQAANRGIPPEAVARAVVHALTARNPKIRYAVGKDAQLRRLFGWLPDTVRDWIITSKAGLPTAGSKRDA